MSASRYESKEHVLDLVARRQWESSGGKVCDVAKMDTSHIRNCIRWVQRHDIPAGGMLIGMFEHELELRGADVPASAELEERFKKLCGITRSLLLGYEELGGDGRKYRRILDAMGADVR